MKRSSVEEYYDRHARSYGGWRVFDPNDTRNGVYFADQTCWHFLRKYAPRKKSSLILEAGAGTGDWGLLFAKLGYGNLVLSDISRGMLDVARRKFARLGITARFVRSDITNLKEFQPGMFDYVFSQYDAVSFCLKPREAVKAMARVAKRGAHVVASMDTKFARVTRLIDKMKLDKASRLLKTGVVSDYWDDWSDLAYPSHPLTWEELSGYFEQAGLDVVEVVGAEVFTNHLRKNVLDVLKSDPRKRKRLLEMEVEHCTDKSLVNMASHLLMIGLKR